MQGRSLVITGSDGDDLLNNHRMDDAPDGVIDAGARRKGKQTLVLLSQKLGYDHDDFGSDVAAKLSAAANFASLDVYKKYNPMKMEWRKLVNTKKSHDANDIFKRVLRDVMKTEGFPCPRGEWEKKLDEMDEKPLQGYYTDERKAKQAGRKRVLAPAANSPGSTDVVNVANSNCDAAGLTGGVERLDASGSKRRRRIPNHDFYAPDNVSTRQGRLPFQAPFTTEYSGVVTNPNRTNESTPVATNYGHVEHIGMNYMPAHPFPSTSESSTYIPADVNSGRVNYFDLGISGISQQDLFPFMSGPSIHTPHTQYWPPTQPLAYPPNAPWVVSYKDHADWKMSGQIESDQFISVLPMFADSPPNARLDGLVQHQENPFEAQAFNWNPSDPTNAAIPGNTTNQHNAPPTAEGSELSDTSLTLFRSAVLDCGSKLGGKSSYSESCETIERFFLRVCSDKAIAELLARIIKHELEKREMGNGLMSDKVEFR